MKLTYDEVVSICDAHGICLPVDCVETVVSIVEHIQPDHSSDGSEKAESDLDSSAFSKWVVQFRKDNGGLVPIPYDAWLEAAKRSAIAAQAAPVPQDGDERAHPFALLCDMLPESTSWGDALTPDIARHIAQAALASNKAAAVATAQELPNWFEMFLTNVCELPDRNSPEDEPAAIVATLEELKACALNAIDQRDAATKPAQTAQSAVAQTGSKQRVYRLSTGNESGSISGYDIGLGRP